MLQKQLYSDQVVEIIKQDLLSGQLSPGDKVNEAHLALRLGVSRAPIREALSVLERDGLVTSTPQKGKSIVKLTPRQVVESMTTGGVLEGWAVATSCHLYTEADLALLRSMVDNFGRGGELQALMTDDSQFHDNLLKYADNDTLVETARHLTRRLSRFLLLPYWVKAYSLDEVITRHRDLFAVVETRRPEQIRQAVLEHYVKLGLRIAESI